MNDGVIAAICAAVWFFIIVPSVTFVSSVTVTDIGSDYLTVQVESGEESGAFDVTCSDAYGNQSSLTYVAGGELTFDSLVPGTQYTIEAVALEGEGSRVTVLANSTADPQDARLTWRTLPADPAAYAQGLYASLRALDAIGADFILIEALPGGPGWRAVADRLGRAAVGSGSPD